MSFSGNLVSFGFEDDVIIYDKLVEVIDNVILGLFQSQKPKQNPFPFMEFFTDPYQNIVFWSKGKFPKEFIERITLMAEEIQNLYNINLKLHDRIKFYEFDETNSSFSSNVYRLCNSTMMKMHFIPYSEGSIHIASDIYSSYYEQGYSGLNVEENNENDVFFFGFDGDDAIAFVHTPTQLMQISFDNLYDTYHGSS